MPHIRVRHSPGGLPADWSACRGFKGQARLVYTRPDEFPARSGTLVGGSPAENFPLV